MTKKVNKVFIVNCQGPDYVKMFTSRGWVITHRMSESDLVQFCGGEDVTPSFYGCHRHPATYNNEKRDLFELLQFKAAEKMGLPMAGICRGGQFLNVMCGGTMWQHVAGHSSPHLAQYYRAKTAQQIYVSSTHHQMMIPNEDPGTYDLMMTAQMNARKEKCNTLHSSLNREFISIESDRGQDIEAHYYKAEKAFCFQPHPEFPGVRYLQQLYFDYLNTLFNLA